MALADHLKSVIYSTVGTIISAGVIAVVLWLKGLPLHWALLVTAGFVLAVSIAAHLVVLIIEKLRKPRAEAQPASQNANDEALARSSARVRELDRTVSNLQDRYDDTEWLREIATEQTKIQDHLEVDYRIEQHRLVGDNTYIEFVFEVTNRCVYKISLSDNLTGVIYFGDRRLTSAPVLSDNSVNNLALNRTQYFKVTQPLTPSEAAEVLTDVPGQFRVYGLHSKIVAIPSLGDPVDFDWTQMTGPIISREFIDNNYPKVDIRITALPLHTYYGQRADANYPQWPLGTIVNLQVCFKNPRPLKVRRFNLVTSGPVISAETGQIKDNPHRDASGQLVPFGTELPPNLADLKVDIARGNVTDGWLQFIIRDIPPQKMLNPADFVVRLHIVDESGEEHRQDVTGLTYNP